MRGDAVRIGGGRPLVGTIRTPGDKSISHRALLLAALAEGTSVIRGLSDGDDVHHTLLALEALGTAVDRPRPGVVRVEGGRGRLHPPAAPLDLGNSGTAMRLLAGVVAGLPFAAELIGDESLSSRPMDRIAEPLRAMGARVQGRGARCLPPLTVRGGGLHGIDWTPSVPSAQVKSCILLAGLSANGETVVRESVSTRSHTEEMLRQAGADLSVEPWGTGRVVRVRPSVLKPLHLDVPGDPSQAAFWVVAGCVVPGSSLVVKGVYAGAERIGFVGVLQRMGAEVTLRPDADGAADVSSRFGPSLRATVVEAAEIPSLDEVPALVVAAAAAEGTTTFRDMAELRVKESDRLAAVVALADAFGARAEAVGDELRVHGVGPGRRLAPGRFDSRGDHRMAMAAAIAALAAGEAGHGGAGGEGSELSGFDVVGTSYPGFLADLRALGGSATAPGGAMRIVAIDGPAGSGKSTVSKALAERLGMSLLDTGAMYRSVAWAVLDRGIDPADGPAVAELARAARIEVGGDGTRIDGTDVTAAIRSPEVSRAVSVVAANPEVRRHLVERQREWASEHHGGVVEGRDIGSVVFPDADLKVYLTASPEERARRRDDESAEGIARRDRIDSTRATSPLSVASGARVLDTTGRTVEDVVEEVQSWL
ncbi:MAG TPA: 3-phosphoshikimate 1-carboxyvinyltransferase [Acidimicrobiales bacterium]|nr:3-phosphoshikimate 1-carboxyvinyltransferase [Acidimicrobiales bacterium]